jgi:hypothetical protein
MNEYIVWGRQGAYGLDDASIQVQKVLQFDRGNIQAREQRT